MNQIDISYDRLSDYEIAGCCSTEQKTTLDDLIDVTKSAIRETFPDFAEKMTGQADYNWQVDFENNRPKKLYFQIKLN